MLNSRTRKLGFFLSLFFNLFNSLVFQIGIFPYLMILWNVFFYPGPWVRKNILRRPLSGDSNRLDRSFPAFATLILFCYFTVQLLLPLRHWIIPGDVNYTEEGHRLSWRMMLRAKSGKGVFLVVNPKTGEKERVRAVDFASRKQASSIRRNPDQAWQYAQILESKYKEKGWDEVEVYARLSSSLNGDPYEVVIDPDIDLTSVGWNYFWHNDWILTNQND